MRIKKARLSDTVYEIKKYSNERLPEIAVVGRSNAGKSSLINKICNNGKLARVSSAPGKTRSINFYLINDEMHLVDLPGYGFARRSDTEREAWGRLIEGYFAATQRLRHLFLLCDIRHDPSDGDIQMVEWLRFYRIPFTVVATKADKLAKSKRKPAAQKIAKQLGAESYIAFSAMDGYGAEDILIIMENVLNKENEFYNLKSSVDN